MLKLSAKRRQQILETLNTLMFASIIVLASGLGAELMKVLPNTFLMRAYCMSPMLVATLLFSTRFIQRISHDTVLKLFDIEDRRIDGLMDVVGRMLDQSEKLAGELDRMRDEHTRLAAAIDELRWAVRNEDNQ